MLWRSQGRISSSQNININNSYNERNPMLDEISRHFREKLKVFFLTDNLILNNKVIPIHQDNFKEIVPATEVKTIAFVDGGQAELFSGGSLHLRFIRVFG